jgi:hypothetical protein
LQNQLLAERLPVGPSSKDVVSPEHLRAVLGNVVALFLGRREKKPAAEHFSSIDTIVDAAIPTGH